MTSLHGCTFIELMVIMRTMLADRSKFQSLFGLQFLYLFLAVGVTLMTEGTNLFKDGSVFKKMNSYFKNNSTLNSLFQVHCGCLQIFDALIEEQKFTNLVYFIF